ncbi:MAG: sugar nucleotide-binding protein, partial [Chloroflexia bacterium]|nr:sugar nucleotide-binding protein [Chloroflexia bacterium]
ACAARGIRTHPLAPDAVVDPATVAAMFEECAPWAVIDARLRRGLVADALIERRRERVAAEVGLLAVAGAERSVPLVVMSSASVFAGAKSGPYVESDPVAPGDPRGRLHAAVEATVAALHPAALVVRAGMPLPSPGSRGVGEGEAPFAVADGRPAGSDEARLVSVAALPDLAGAMLDLLIDGERGVWHLAHPEPLAWSDTDLVRIGAGRGDAEAGPAAGSSPPPASAPPPLPSISPALLGSERGWVMTSLAGTA